MAEKRKTTDKYPNLLVTPVAMTVINTLTYSEINVGLNIFDKVGLLIHRIEYDPALASLQDLDTDGDAILMGISSSNNLSALSAALPEVIDMASICRVDAGAAAVANFIQRPFVRDFSNLPGGGLLVPPKPLYGVINSVGMTVILTGNIRTYFTILSLTDAEYLELLETRRAFG